MEIINVKYSIHHYQLWDNGVFPNSHLDVLVYKNVLDLPLLFAPKAIKNLFERNNWRNSWKDGVYTYHHYHSITHEVLGVYEGKSIIEFGGETGVKVEIEKGDVVIIPAGVAHKNMGEKDQVKCVGAYPEGRDYDMNYGKPSERIKADENIKKLPVPALDPVFGSHGELQRYWKSKNNIYA